MKPRLDHEEIESLRRTMKGRETSTLKGLMDGLREMEKKAGKDKADARFMEMMTSFALLANMLKGGINKTPDDALGVLKHTIAFFEDFREGPAEQTDEDWKSRDAIVQTCGLLMVEGASERLMKVMTDCMEVVLLEDEIG